MTEAKKAAEEFAKTNAFRPLERMYDCKETFLAGAAWQAEQDKAEIARLREVHKTAQDLLNNYLKCNQYPENITFNQRIVEPLRDAVIKADQALAEKKGDA